MIGALEAMTKATETAAKALSIMADLVEKQRAENEKLRKIIEEYAPHRLKEVYND